MNNPTPSLDKKLEHVLYEHRNDSPIGLQSALIADIKQAFIDESPELFKVYSDNELYRLLFGEIRDPYGRVDTSLAFKNYQVNEDFHKNFGRYMEAVRTKLDNDYMTKDQWEQQAIKNGWVKPKSKEHKAIGNGMYRYCNCKAFADHLDQDPKSYADGYVDSVKDGLVRNEMTGQEWYDKFEKELKLMDMRPPLIDGWYIDAAKKAAGIE